MSIYTNKYKNKGLAIIIFAILATSIIAVDAVKSDQTETVIKIENIQVTQKGLHIARISILNITNLGSYDISVKWNPTLLSVKQIGSGKIDEIFTYINDTKGVLNITAYNLTSVTTDEICVAEILFDVVGDSGNSCNLTLEDTELLSAEVQPSFIEHMVDNAEVQITESNGSIVRMNDVTIKTGENATGFLTGKNFSNTVGSFDVMLEWDPDVVRVMNVSGGDFDEVYSFVNNDIGLLSLNGISAGGVSGDFVFGEIVFEGVAGGFCDLSVVDCEVLSADPVPMVVDCSCVDGVAVVENASLPVVSMGDVVLGVGEQNSSVLCGSSFDEVIGSFMVNVSFDSSVVSVVNVSGGDFDEVYSFVNNDIGLLSLNGISAGGVSGDFVFGEIVFEGVTSGFCDLSVVDCEVLSADPVPMVVDCSCVDGVAMVETDDSPADDDDDNGEGGNTGGNGGGGTVVPPANKKPTAVATVDNEKGQPGLTCIFDASESYDSDGTIESYEWDFDDGSTEKTEQASISHTFESVGIYEVMLTVTDNDDETDALDAPIIIEITLGNSPPTNLQVSTGETFIHKNNSLTFEMSAVDPDENDTIRFIIDWDDDSAEFVSPNQNSSEKYFTEHAWKNYGFYSVKIHAEDTENAPTESKTIGVYVDVKVIDDEIKGWLVDGDSDGIFDWFERTSDNTKFNVKKNNETNYFISGDDNESWAYSFNVITEELTTYNSRSDDVAGEDSEIAVYILGGLILILFLLFGYLALKNREDEKKKEKQKESKKKKSSKK